MKKNKVGISITKNKQNNMIESHIVFESSPRRDKKILGLIKSIDKTASYAGGVAGNGDRVIIANGTPNQYKEILNDYIEDGIVKSIDKF
ncbi:MAG: hypothetical protein H8E55_03485 [Pelagibacterales bacterium]|nr:hypothetical protein [Pelagibacterales bacterium]